MADPLPPAPNTQACKRTMDCKCPECVAAAAAFSVDDLRAIKSNITYGTGWMDAYMCCWIESWGGPLT